MFRPNPLRSLLLSFTVVSILTVGPAWVANAASPADPLRAASPAASLSLGWSSAALGPLPASGAPAALPFYVTRGGPGLVAMSQAEGGGNTPSVWVSADGRQWRYKHLDPHAFAQVQSLARPVQGKHGLVLAGTLQASGGNTLPEGAVWTSGNGLAWNRVSVPSNLFTGASLHAVSAGGPGYVAAGTVQSQPGPAPASAFRAAIWTSSDGSHWQAVTDGGPGFRAAFITGVAAGGPGLVAVGFANPTLGHPPVPAIWTSTGGRSWRRLALGRAFGNGGIDQVVAGKGELLALGHDYPPRGAQRVIIWTSRDGLHWRRAASDPFAVNYRAPVVTALGDGFAAAGWYDNAPALWTSVDGSHWTLAAANTIFGGGFTTLNDAVAWRNGLAVVGERTDPTVVASHGTSQPTTGLAWLWTPGTRNAPHPDWAASDPLWFRVRQTDLGSGFIARTGSYGMACALIPDLEARSAPVGHLRPAVRAGFDSSRCLRALAALDGSTAFSFNFGYGQSNLYGPEPEVTGFAILTRDAAQSRAAYAVGGGIVIAGDLNLNSGEPEVAGSVKMAQGGTLYRIATQGFGTAYAVVWRAGRALGMVEAVGLPGDLKARAIALARAQWQHWRASAGRSSSL